MCSTQLYNELFVTRRLMVSYFKISCIIIILKWTFLCFICTSRLNNFYKCKFVLLSECSLNYYFEQLKIKAILIELGSLNIPRLWCDACSVHTKKLIVLQSSPIRLTGRVWPLFAKVITVNKRGIEGVFRGTNACSLHVELCRSVNVCSSRLSYALYVGTKSKNDI